MTVYSYSRVLVWDNLGGSVKVARNQRVDVTDPATGLVAAGLTVKGQPVSYVTSDGDGHVTFSSTMGLVRLTSQRGFWQDVESPDLRSGAVQAGIDAAAAAASAATSATAATGAATAAATQATAAAQSKIDASAAAAASSATAAQSSANLVGAPAGAAIDAAAGSTVTRYVSPTGNDSASGKTWGSAKATIAAAITSLGGPGTVWVNDGTYTQSTRTSIPSGVTIRGTGPNSVIKLANASTSSPDLFYLNGVTNVRILDLAFDGNTANQTQADANTQRGILIQNSDNISITGCTFKDHQHQAIQVLGATPSDSTTHGAKGLVVDRCSFTNVWTALHITQSDTSDVRFTNNVVDGSGEHGFTTYPGCSRIVVKGNLFRNCGTRVSPTYTTFNFGCGVRIFETTDAVVEGNIIENPNYWGIRVTTNSPTSFQQASRVTVANNVIRGGARAGLNGGGIIVGEQGRSSDVTVSGNTVEGFTAYTDAAGIQVLGDRCTVMGNTVRNTAKDGVRIVGDGCAVVGNTLTDTGLYGVQVGGTQTVDTVTITGNLIRGTSTPITRGVYVQSNARNVRLSGNSMVNVTAQTFNGGTSPIWADGAYLATAVPTAGSFLKGDRVRNTNPFDNSITSWVCTVAGTAGTLSSVTATTVSGSAAVTVNSTTGLNVGTYIAIAGVAGQKLITGISGTTVTVDVAADASVTGAAVSYSAPTFNAEGASSKYGTLTWDPASIASGSGLTSPGIAVSGAALGDYVVVAPPYDIQGLSVSAYVSAGAVVTIRLNNTTGAAVDLASGSWKVKVIKS